MRGIRGKTIQDVAQIAGVSSTRISNYLNGRLGEMRQETRQRIAKAIKDLGYIPNSAARQLKTGNAPILGLLLPSVVNPYFAELAVAVDAAAQKKAFGLFSAIPSGNPNGNWHSCANLWLMAYGEYLRHPYCKTSMP